MPETEPIFAEGGMAPRPESGLYGLPADEGGTPRRRPCWAAARKKAGLPPPARLPGRDRKTVPPPMKPPGWRPICARPTPCAVPAGSSR